MEASSAEEALEHVKRAPPDVVLLDFNMPGKDGLQLAAELHQSNPDLSVAVISANRQIEVINRARAAGATFLPKPLTTEALRDFLNIVAKHREGAR
jgi:CheY-like chemotaxis protein